MLGKACVSHSSKIEKAQTKPRAGGKRKSAKAKEFTRGRGMAEYRNLGRQRERLQAAHRRATEDAGRRGLRFSSGFWFGIGCRRCGAKFSFLIKFAEFLFLG